MSSREVYHPTIINPKLPPYPSNQEFIRNTHYRHYTCTLRTVSINMFPNGFVIVNFTPNYSQLHTSFRNSNSLESDHHCMTTSRSVGRCREGGRRGDSPSIHWRHWSLSSVSSVNTRTVIFSVWWFHNLRFNSYSLFNDQNTLFNLHSIEVNKKKFDDYTEKWIMHV